MNAFAWIVLLLGIFAVYAIMFGLLRPRRILRALRRLLLFLLGFGIAIAMLTALLFRD